MTTGNLLAFYHKQDPAMQGALKAFWRGVAGSEHKLAPVFRQTLATIHHNEPSALGRHNKDVSHA